MIEQTWNINNSKSFLEKKKTEDQKYQKNQKD